MDPGAAENVFDIYPPLFHFDGYENNSGKWNNVFRMVPRNPPAGYNPQTQTHLVPVLSVFTDGPGPVNLEDPKTSQTYNLLNHLKTFHKDGLISDEEYSVEKQKLLTTLLAQ